MNKLNKFLILFLLFFTVLFWGTWEFIQSEQFSSILVSKVSKKIEEISDGKLKFKRIEFQLFPPATLVKDIEIEYSNPELKLDVELDATGFGLYFNILDVFSSKFKVQKIKISDAVAKVKIEGLKIDQKLFEDLINSKDDKSEKIKINEIFEKYLEIFHLQKKVQLGNIEADNLKLILNDSYLFVDNLRVTPKEKNLNLSVNFTDINLYPPEKNKLNFNLDQILLNTKLERNSLEVENVLIKKGHSTISGTMLLAQQNNKDIINTDLNVSGPLYEYVSVLPYNKELEDIEGHINLNLLGKGDVDNLNLEAVVNLDQFVSHWARAQKAELKVYKRGKYLGIAEASVYDDGGVISAHGPRDIYNISEKRFVYGNNDILLSEVNTHTMLHYLRKSLSPFKGKFSGKINTAWSEQGLEFKNIDTVNVKNLKLEFPNSKHPVVTNPDIDVKTLLLNVDWSGKIKIDTSLSFLKNELNLSGTIIDDTVDFKLISPKFDFEKFGPISGVEFKGFGVMNVDVTGPFEDVLFKFTTSLDDFGLININFGKVTGNFNLYLKDLRLSLENLEGDSKGAKYSGNGEFFFGDKSEFELNFDLKKSNHENLSYMLPQLISKMTFLPKDIEYTATAKLNISGGYSLEELIVEGQTNFKNLFFWGEDYEWLNANVDFANKNINLNNIQFAKSQARGSGNVVFDMNKDFLNMDLSFKKAKLSEFNFYKSVSLGYDAEIEGEYSSRGFVGDLENKGSIRTTSATLAQRPAQGSEVAYTSKKSRMNINAKLMGETFLLNSIIDLSGTREKNSSIDLKVQTNNIANLFGLLSEHNVKNKDIEGELDCSLNSKFSLDNLNGLDFNLVIDKFSFFTERLFFSLSSPAHLKINNGEIEKWNLNWPGKNIEITSQGSGSFSNRVTITTKFNVDPSIIEILTEKLQFIAGILEGEVKLSTDGQKVVTTTHISGNDLGFRSTIIPSQFTSMSFNLDGVNRSFYLDVFKGFYSGGKFGMKGNIEFKLPFPKLDLNIDMEGANVPILKKSSFVADSKSNIKGDSLPYLFSGLVNLTNVNINDEFTEISKNKKTNVKNSRFIPEIAQDENLKIMQYNFDLNFLRPMIVKNNIADFRVNGQFNVQGYDTSPLLKGELNLVPGTSKFIFKNNEFTLDEGKVTFLGEEKDNNPAFRFLGTTTVNEYFIRMDFSGRPSNFNLNFTSDPLLSQEDIVSLLTVGLTLDKSKGLNSNELQSVTSIGLGSLLLDQFGINQGLKSSLGLKLSVLPYYQKSTVSPITSATSSGDLSTSRLRSATKLRVEKKINKKMDMSVSSTVGGNIEQKREMNLDYNINKNYSVKGVYEVRSSTGTETKENSNSMGMDFIFRRTFK